MIEKLYTIKIPDRYEKVLLLYLNTVDLKCLFSQPSAHRGKTITFLQSTTLTSTTARTQIEF